MDRIKFFLAGIKADRHLDISWIINVYNLCQYPYSDELLDFKPYDIAQDRDNGHRVYFDPEEKSFKPIMGIKPLEPIIGYKEKYNLVAGDLENLKEDIVTLGGNILANLYYFIIPFKDKINYINRKLSSDDINAEVEKLIQAGEITADEFYFYCDSVNATNAYWAISTPTGSEATLGASPAVIARRDELLKQHADELDNSVVLAGIENELVQMDKASIKGTVSEDFFMTEKSYANTRKKMHIIYGLDDGLGGGKPAFIPTALSQGLSAENIPAAADSTRAASYSRGFLTAQGGELVNYLYRIFMNSKIAEDDCGTKKGVSILLTENNMKRYYGRYGLDPSGKTYTVDPQVAKSMLGKTITIRTPARCKSQAPNFCGHCTDEYFFKARETVHIETSLPGSIIMNDRMKAMHGRVSKLAQFHYKTHLT